MYVVFSAHSYPGIVPTIPSRSKSPTHAPPFLVSTKRELELLRPGQGLAPPPTAYDPPSTGATGALLYCGVRAFTRVICILT